MQLNPETKIALIQMRCGPEPEKNFSRAIEFIRDAAKKGATDRLSAGAFSVAIFLPDRRPQKFRAGRGNSGQIDICVGRSCARNWRGNYRVAFRETQRRRLSQHRRDHRRRRKISRQISQDAYPGRSALSREVLFHAGRSRVSRRGTRRAGRSASAFAGTNGIRKRRA